MLKNKLFAGAIFVLATLVAGSVSAAYTFPNKIDTLQEKKDVQTVLNMVVTPNPQLTADGVFGPKTIAAVKAFQTMKGLTADGKIGPMTRAALEAAQAGATVATAGCPAGALFNATTGAPCTTVTTTLPAGCVAGAAFSSTTGASCTTGVVTPVVSGNTEGSMTLQSAPVSVLTSVGQSEVGDNIAAFAVKAKGSDIKIQRVNVSLAGAALPWKFFSNLSLYQDGTLLATLPVTSTSLTENIFAANYTAVFNGLNVVVAKEGTVNFIVKADIVGTLPSSLVSFVVGLNDASTGDVIRGIDGMGLSQYVSKTDTYNRTINFTTTTTGKLSVVANGSNPIAQNVVTSATSVTTGIPALIFNLQNTSKSDTTLKTIKATVLNNTHVSAYYLYDGATMISSIGNPSTTDTGTTSISFANLPSTFVVAGNSTKTLTIKMDVSATASPATPGSELVTVGQTDITAVDSNSNLLVAGTNLTGTATGLTQTFQASGVVVNLVSATATATPSTTSASGFVTGTFVFKVKANGVNLAKLSTWTNLQATGTGITYNATPASATYTYTVSPDTTVSDGSEVTVTLNTVKTTSTPGWVKFTISDLKFMDTTPTLIDVGTGFDNFYTNSVYAN